MLNWLSTMQSCGVVSRIENGGASEPVPMDESSGNKSNSKSHREIYTGSQSMSYRRDFQEVICAFSLLDLGSSPPHI